MTLTGATTPGQIGPERNTHAEVLDIPQISKPGASPSNSLLSYPRDSLRSGVLILCRVHFRVPFDSASSMQCVLIIKQKSRKFNQSVVIKEKSPVNVHKDIYRERETAWRGGLLAGVTESAGTVECTDCISA